MKALVLAAGLGTRLGEVTAHTPKCLVEVGGKALVWHVVEHLKQAGVDHIVINLFHLADQVEAFVRANHSFGIQVDFSKEEVLLGTGGALHRVAPLLRHETTFLVHNADIWTDVDLQSMIVSHQRRQALASLAVMHRETQRYMLFDTDDRLVGWRNNKTSQERVVRSGTNHPLAFSGIQVLSPGIFAYMEGLGQVFSVTEPYLSAAAAGEKVLAYRMDGAYWIDAGTPDRLAALNQRLTQTSSGTL